MVEKDCLIMKEAPKVSRRRFSTGAAAAFGIPYIIPSRVLAAPGRPGANDRIVIGHIGVGGMGSGHVQPDAAALGDVDKTHLAANAKRVQGSPFLCKDYRLLLGDPEMREDARLALERIPGGASTRALQHALQTAPAEFRPNLEQSLRHKRVSTITIGFERR
jgi:hypothetical protein